MVSVLVRGVWGWWPWREVEEGGTLRDDVVAYLTQI